MDVDGEESVSSDRLPVTLQLGLQSQQVVVEKGASVLYTLRHAAHELIRAQRQSAEQPEITPDRVLLFVHDHEAAQALQPLTHTSTLTHNAVVQVVLSLHQHKPTTPHLVQVHNYVTPTFCNFCGEILVGLIKQGLKCQLCQHNFHKRCVFAPFNNCAHPAATAAANAHSPAQEQPTTAMVATHASSDAPPQAAAAAPLFHLPHTFVVHSYKRPTVCKHCDNLLVGLVKQGLQCRDCRVNVHKKCAAFMLNDCRPTEAAAQPTQSLPLTSANSVDMTMVESSSQQQQQQQPEPGPEQQEQLIQLMRIPGGAATMQPKQPAILLEGWQLHFTNHQPERRLRHYWVLEQQSLAMYSEGMHRKYKQIALAEILGLHPYNGAPLDARFPPHCFEIQTQCTIYYVGENLEYYKQTGQTPVQQAPRRNNQQGVVTPEQWFEALTRALLPPGPVRDANHPAIEFSQIYQVNPTEELGSGQFGTVYGGSHRQTGQKVAVKVIAKERFGKRQQKQLFSEVTILKSVQHPGIIKLLSMFDNKNKIFVVMEKMEADMLEMILSSRLMRLNERNTKFLIVQILTALKYLHSRDIAHCDLKPENVLLSSADTDYPQTKLCDFGYARCIEESQFRNTMVGTPAYLAPEVLKKKGYNKSLDMWALGVVIYVTLSGTFPFNEGEDIEVQIRNAAFMFPSNPWAQVTQHAVDLIQQLLKVKIEERFTIEQAQQHGWFDDAYLYVDLRRLEAKQPAGVNRYLTTAEQDTKYAAEARSIVEAEQSKEAALPAPSSQTTTGQLVNVGDSTTDSMNHSLMD